MEVVERHTTVLSPIQPGCLNASDRVLERYAQKYDPRTAHDPLQYPEDFSRAYPPHQSPIDPQSPWAGGRRQGPYATPPHSDHAFPEADFPNPRQSHRRPGYRAPYAEEYEETQAPSNPTARARRPMFRDPQRPAKTRPRPDNFEMTGRLGSNASRSCTSGASRDFDDEGPGPMGGPRRRARGGSRVD